MPLSLEQVQLQTQKLVLTPQMQLSIKLLQMNTLELEQLARQEVLENPFLEMEPEEEEEEEEVAGQGENEPEKKSAENDPIDAPSPDPAEKTEGNDAETAALDTDEPVAEPPPPDSNEGAETFDEVDVEWDEYYDDTEPRLASVKEQEAESRDFTQYTAASKSLYDHLMWQLHASGLDEKDTKIGEYLIGSIDDNGYLTTTIEEAAEALKVEPKDVERVLETIQGFEPTGVGARDLRECILIQLESRGLTDPIYREILTNHFEKLGQQKFRQIARALGVEEERVVEAFKEIRRCDPKPGRSITKQTPRYVEPDVIVKKIDGQYLYYLNEGDLGHLRINNYYKRLLQSDNNIGDKEREYYKEKYRSAVWLIRNIERRKSTILRVTEAIMRFQKDFLEKGPEHLRPLTLKQIAEVVGMHEATIARVTANKYVETPRGVFPLKYFFSSSLDRADGGSASSRSVKEMIRKLIAEEDPKAPLSDSAIAEILKKRGFKIARRTVAKYRSSMKILPANLRKKTPTT